MHQLCSKRVRLHASSHEQGLSIRCRSVTFVNLTCMISQKVGQGYKYICQCFFLVVPLIHLTLRSSRQALSASGSDPSSLAQLRESMDSLLKTILHPTYQAPTNAAVIRETLVNLARYARALEAALPLGAFESKADPPPLARAELEPELQPEEYYIPPPPNTEPECPIIEGVKRSLVLTGSSERYFGPASSISFILTARKLTDGNFCALPKSSPASLARYMRPHFWSVLPVSILMYSFLITV